MPDVWMADLIQWIAHVAGVEYPFVVKSILTIVVMCLLCGTVGAMVVGNRMAFFSDAMAHCAFAGIALGFLTVLLSNLGTNAAAWLVPLIMVAFGVVVGVGMIYVRDRTNLAHDTVIGVFFALALGFGAMLTKLVQRVSSQNLETFLFGNLTLIPEMHLLYLCGALVLVCLVFLWRYNQLMFASFNASLARTRRMNVSFNNYLFIILLSLVVNLSIQAVGALLINALLVVPAAAATNVSRNMRQMFWFTIAFSLSAGLIGYSLSSWTVTVGPIRDVQFSPSGVIVVVTVGMFFGSMVVVAVWNRFAPIFGGKQFRGFHGPNDPCGTDHPFGQCP
ncbi:High-affinity zinc uptake system membrane protein ZnuB [Gemmata sp. SH-PL17]|uniref:metal ABC transporter permease n=1 Tax=Gemmata sp. SH-PL17 TaxID=1630693 RepID=UPI0004B12E87|nr:metal ABC transporter permease [Gemmata sp. SH-PL17]AMV26523.1 High-affinity zinc uptake system membrane protein ZnuB [Gemmata sp. SH-PL17]